MTQETKEQRVLESLQKFGRLPSARLAAVAGLNYDSFIIVATKLLQQKKIQKIEETVATYWELQDGKD